MGEVLPPVRWKISSRCADTGANCVEAGPLTDGSGRVAVRRAGVPDTAAIVYARAEWAAFVAGVKAGAFDVA